VKGGPFQAFARERKRDGESQIRISGITRTRMTVKRSNYRLPRSGLVQRVLRPAGRNTRFLMSGNTFKGFYDHWCHLLLVAALIFDDEARRYLSLRFTIIERSR
jgi:hypothetical protein